MDKLSTIRRRYAEEICAVSNIRSKALVEAFARVPREHFLGPGPWQIVPNKNSLWQKFSRLWSGSYLTTPDDNPRHLYQNVLVAIDPSRQLNNGQPSYLAFCLDALDLQEGDRVLHVGCGVGYYTAIIAEVVGPTGHITGVEVDVELASQSRQNLSYLQQVEVVTADGGEYDSGSWDAIFVNAGATHPRAVWLDRLQPGGRLVLFLTTTFGESHSGRGGMFKIKHEESGYAAQFLRPVSVFPCIGSRNEDSNRRLDEALRHKPMKLVQSLRREIHEIEDTCWLHSDDFCLSMLSLSTGA